jgi:hypothetical protein
MLLFPVMPFNEINLRGKPHTCWMFVLACVLKSYQRTIRQKTCLQKQPYCITIKPRLTPSKLSSKPTFSFLKAHKNRLSLSSKPTLAHRMHVHSFLQSPRRKPDSFTKCRNPTFQIPLSLNNHQLVNARFDSYF